MIPGQIISIITFLGVIVHEWAHKMVCRLFGVQVFDIKYFALSGAYVRHAHVDRPGVAICIALAPLVVNLLVALVMGCVLAAMRFMDVRVVWLYVLVCYVGVTVGMHAFPSKQDMDNFTNLTAELRRRNLNMLARVMGGFFGVLRVFSVFWADMWIAVMVMAAPTFVLRYSVPEFRARHDTQTNVRKLMDDCGELRTIVRTRFADTDFEAVGLYSVDRATGAETETINPYGKPFIAFRDAGDAEYFFVFTMDVPQRDCRYLLAHPWDDAVGISSPEDCANEQNAVLVRYHK